MKTVLCFGTFDCLHAGHQDFIRQARYLGDYLIVVVARDATVKIMKQQIPVQNENIRLATIQAQDAVNLALLGDYEPDNYDLLSKLDFDILALGYDQIPDDKTVRSELNKRRKTHVLITRLKSYRPHIYKSSRLREKKL